MIGLLLVTHGRLAEELISALEHIVGTQKHIITVCISPEDDMDKRRCEILEKTIALDQGSGVILLTDMFGGTPSNLAISIMEEANVEVITGVNLPMLIKLASVRQSRSLPETIIDAQKAGRRYINVASNLLSRENS